MPNAEKANLSLNLTYESGRENETNQSISILEPVDLKDPSPSDGDTLQVNENNTNIEHFVFEDLKNTLSTILEDSLCPSDASSDHGKHQNDKNEDSVLLSNIYDLFITMNGKIDRFCMDFGHFERCKGAFNKVFASLKLKDAETAYSQVKDLYIMLFNNAQIDYRNEERVLSAFNSIKKTLLPSMLCTINEIYGSLGDLERDKACLKEKVKKSELDVEAQAMKSAKLTEEFESSLGNLESDMRKKSHLIDFLWGCIADLNHFMCGHPINFLDEAEIKKFFQKVREELRHLKEECDQLKTQKRDMKSKPNESDLHLKKELEEKERTIASLEEENNKIMSQINKIAEKHAKYKKEMLFLNKDVTKMRESGKKKSDLIEKQRKIISILQKRASANPSKDIIEDLRQKIKRLREKMEVESEFFARKKILKDISEYERLLSDFISLWNKN